MKCPVCSVDLTMSERQGVEIDYCPKCRGVWLDRGELDKILERSHAEGMPAPPPQRGAAPAYPLPPVYQQSYGDQYYKQKRKKNMLDELFDF
ncbi:MAG: zf-TFIIB domain-containing protein [Bacteroidetes bacterium]|nr:zf-TFIIB domain-containing protein [Bacteroidota bacterium]